MMPAVRGFVVATKCETVEVMFDDVDAELTLHRFRTVA